MMIALMNTKTRFKIIFWSLVLVFSISIVPLEHSSLIASVALLGMTFISTTQLLYIRKKLLYYRNKAILWNKVISAMSNDYQSDAQVHNARKSEEGLRLRTFLILKYDCKNQAEQRLRDRQSDVNKKLIQRIKQNKITVYLRSYFKKTVDTIKQHGEKIKTIIGEMKGEVFNVN